MSVAFDRNAPQYRLPAIRMVDVILATLQAAFQEPTLLDGQNPYLFVPTDPKNSRVWISDPDARVDGQERDGQRMFISVARGTYVPRELGLQNRAGGSWQGAQQYLDMASAVITVTCEAGNKLSAEALGSICYNILKMFRHQIQADFDIDTLKLQGISPPVRRGDVAGQPWLVSVDVYIEMREQYVLTNITNTLNIARIIQTTLNSSGSPETPVVLELG